MFTYDGEGIRTSKTVNGVEHKYYYSDAKLLRETYGSNILDFAYNADGSLYSLRYNQTYYYYITNLQGDVIGLVDVDGTAVASYEYDPYGDLVSATGSMASINPMRYRGYYYDAETGFYYLQSRYYDPEIGRFINADALMSTGQGILGNNMFAYCRNNPVCRIDISGSADVDCYDNDPLDEEDILKTSQGGGVQTGGNSGYTNGAITTFGHGQAPKNGTPGSMYTQISSDGKDTVISQTTYGEFGAPAMRIDYQGRDHGIGLPHVHEYYWGIRDGRVVPTGKRIYLYRMD